MKLVGLPCIVGVGGNLNFGNCNFNLQNAVANIAVPAGTKIPRSELNAFIATILEMMHEDDPYARAHIIKGIKGVEKANIDPVTGNWGDGTPYTVRDERVGRTYTMENLCSNQGLASLNGKHDMYEFFHVFAGNVVAGTLTAMDTGEEAVKGLSLAEIFTSQYDEAMNDTPAQYIHRMVHADPTEWRNIVAFKPENGNVLRDLVGMMTIELVWLKNTPQVAGTYQIEATTGCGQINIASEYATELVAEALWIVKNHLGNAVAVDGVTINGLDNFVLALDTTDPNYTAGTSFTATLALPSVLNTANVSWYEATKVKFPK